MRKWIDILLRNPTHNLWIQLLRYGVVGGTAFVVDFGLLYALTEWAGLYYMVSACLAFVAGLVVNYMLSIQWVFVSRSMLSRKAEFVVFALVGIVGLGLNAGIIWILTAWMGCYYMLSKGVSTLVVFLWNFGARRVLLFGKQRDTYTQNNTPA